MNKSRAAPDGVDKALLPIREQQKLMTRERLLNAAVKVFLERGYADTTIDEIAAAAAAGRATFYLHFRGKLDLMRDLIQEREEQNEVLIGELQAIRDLTHESLEEWLGRFVSHWASQGDRFLVGLQAIGSEPELAAQLDTGISLMTDVLKEWIVKLRDIEDNEATLRSELLVNSLQRACRALVSNPDLYDQALVTKVLTDIWARNLID